MRYAPVASMILVFVLGCWSSTNGDSEEFGSTETAKMDTGSETTPEFEGNTGIDSSESSTESFPDSSSETSIDSPDTSEEIDTGAYDGPCSCSPPTSPKCSDFPPSNEPDGCKRILLDKLPNGQAFHFGATDPRLSRDGNFAVFTQFMFGDTDCAAASGIASDTNLVEDVYLVDLQTFELELMSVSDDGTPGNQSSGDPSISEDGRFVAFNSRAKNLTTPPPKATQIYVRDRKEGTTQLVSVSNSGKPANNSCSAPLISADGRFVLFVSSASNLVPGDINGEQDLFLRDRKLKSTERISAEEDGAETDNRTIDALGISKDGRFVLFRQYSSHQFDFYLRDRTTGRNWMPGSSAHNPVEHSVAGALMISDDGKTILLHTDPSRFGIDVPENRRTANVIATLGNNGFTYKALLPPMDLTNGLSGIDAIDESMTAVAMESCHSFENVSRDDRVKSACALDMKAKKVSLITASEDGRPGIMPSYEMMVDWVELSNFSADGTRILFSTVLYGIVDNAGVCCTDTPRHIYLRDCRL